MDFELLVVRGRSGSEALKLVDGITTVGRQDECQIRIKSSQVSRRHCELFEKKGLLIVKDLGSSNGTFVNGKKIQGQQVLEPGDELMVGQVTLRVARVGETPPVKEAAASAPSAADTSVVEALPAADSDMDEVQFDIAFDDEPVPAEPAETPASMTPVPRAAAPEPKKPKAPPAPVPDSAEPDIADEAIADFLLDIKLDDEE